MNAYGELEVYEMVNKKWYMSKAVWGAGIVFAGAILTALGFPDVANSMYAVGASMGIIGIRTAKTNLN